MHMILVVEDDALLALALIQVLEEAGFEIDRAETVERAKKKVVDGRPAAVVLDASLYGVWSTEVAALLDRLEIPYVVFSGSDVSEIAKWAHPVEFIEKPAPLGRIVHAVEAIVGDVPLRLRA